MDEVSEIFNLDEIQDLNNGWIDCAYDKELLDKFFDIEKLQKWVKKTVTTFVIDVNIKGEAWAAMESMSQNLMTMHKKNEKKKANNKKEEV